MKKREEGYILGQVVIAIAIISAILMSATSMYINLNKNTSLEEERIQAMVLAYNKWQEISSASYDKVESEARKVSQLEPFEIETSVGAETTLPSGDKSKTVTVSVFKGSATNPSFSLPAEKLSSQGSSSSLPAGAIIPWYGNLASIPSGFAYCDGSNGTPDLRGRTIVGTGRWIDAYGSVMYSLGDAAGERMHKLTITEMPTHNHWQGANTTPWASLISATGMSGRVPEWGSYGTGYSGGDQAHNTMMPYLALHWLMKL